MATIDTGKFVLPTAAPERPRRHTRPSRVPRGILWAGGAYLAVALVASYAVDVHDVLGLRTRMVDLGMDHPALW